MNKDRIKGAAFGFILCAILSATVLAAANTETVTRQITYGVNVNFNGEILQFDDDMRPFNMDGRVFLSVRAISETLDLSVDFDSATNTVLLGNAVIQTETVAPPAVVEEPESGQQVQFNSSRPDGWRRTYWQRDDGVIFRLIDVDGQYWVSMRHSIHQQGKATPVGDESGLQWFNDGLQHVGLRPLESSILAWFRGAPLPTSLLTIVPDYGNYWVRDDGVRFDRHPVGGYETLTVSISPEDITGALIGTGLGVSDVDDWDSINGPAYINEWLQNRGLRPLETSILDWARGGPAPN